MSFTAIRASGRRLAATFFALVVALGVVVSVQVQPAASAQTTNETPPEESVIGGSPRPGNGKGTLTTARNGQYGAVAPGGYLTVRGTGYASRPSDGFLAFKINDGAVKFPSQKGDVDEVDDTGTAYFRGNKLPNEDGAFTGRIRLPDDIEPGWYWVRNLSGSDGGTPVTKFAWFKVDPDAGSSEGDDEEEEDTSPAAVPGAPTATGDVISLPLTVRNFEPGATLTARLADSAARFVTASGTAESVVLNADGYYQGTIELPAGQLKAGERKWLTVSDDTGITETPVLTGVPGAEFINWQTGREDTSIGAQVDVNLSNLPAGAKVTAVGAQGGNWAESEPVTADANGTATVLNVRIANVRAGTPIQVVIEHNGTTSTLDSGHVVNAASGGINESAVTKKCVPIPSGTGEVEYGAQGNALYLARQSESGSELIKFNATTLEEIARRKVSAEFHVENLALDDASGQLWATNPEQGTVAVYNATDLTLRNQFAPGETPGVREIAVDTTSHRAYVTKQTSGFGEVDFYDGNQLGRGKAGSVRIENFGPTGPIDINPANGDVFVGSTSLPRAAKIAARDGSNTIETHYQNDLSTSWSAIAYDPDQWNIWLANQNSSELTVLDAPGQQVVNSVFAGASTLDMHYDPRNKVVYAASSGAGTVTVFDAATLQRRASIRIGAGASDLASDPAGNAYVVTQGNEAGQTLCSLTLSDTTSDDGGHAEGSLGNVSEQIFGPGSAGSAGSADEQTGNLGSLAPVVALGIGALGIGAMFAIQEGLNNAGAILPPDLQRLLDALFA